MSGVFRYLGRVLGFSKAQPTFGKTANVLQNATARDLTRFTEGDRVLVDGSKLTFPLTKNAKFDLSRGQLQFNDIIGKPVTSSYIRSSKGNLHRVELPTLEDYVTLTPRLVTPVYSSYAFSIVSLLDVHPEPYDERVAASGTSPPRIEILEAGTGHGSLTLHLARTIAATNPPPPTAQLPKLRTPTEQRPTVSSSAAESGSDALTQAWTQWKQTRRAIIHSVEAVPPYSIHAEKMVRGFRRGLYWPHVDFYTGDVKDWLAQHQHKDGDEFLDYVLLDMPGVHEQLDNASAAMRDGAKLIVFVPSITQIADCLRVASEEGLPLEMVKVLELGEGISNGRKWDVRFVKPRKALTPVINGDGKKNDEVAPVVVTKPGSDEGNIDPGTASEEGSEGDEIEPLTTSDDQKPVMVCRPLVGERTFGGGFIALFKKVSPASAALRAEWRQSQTGRAKKRNRG